MSLRRLVETYRPLASSRPAIELYALARLNGVKKLDAFVLLRDLYGYGLGECKDVADQVDDPLPPEWEDRGFAK